MQKKGSSKFTANVLSLMEKVRSFAFFRIKRRSANIMVRGEERELASFNRRIISITIDVLMIVLMCAPISQIASNELAFAEDLHKVSRLSRLNDRGKLSEEQAVQFRSLREKVIIKFVLIQAVQMIFIGIFLYISHRCIKMTPGKFITRCQVIDMQTEEELCGVKVMLRILAYVPSFCLLGIGLMMMALSKNNRALHDMIVGTVVVVRKR